MQMYRQDMQTYSRGLRERGEWKGVRIPWDLCRDPLTVACTSTFRIAT